MPHKLRFENFYKTILTTPITDASGDITIKVAQPPVNPMGFLILSPENVVQREICFYHAVSGNDISVRGVNRKSPKTHSSQETVKINDVAEIFDFINENISTTFYCEKIGNLSVKMWGGYVAYNGTPQTVADTEFTFGANSINYLVYDYYGNAISNSNTDTGNVRAVVTCSGGVIASIEYRHSKDSMIDKNIARETTILTLTLIDTAVVEGETFQSAFGKIQGQINAIRSSMYLKTEVDGLLSVKANQATSYLKTEVDGLLSVKANQATSYLKTEVDGFLATKANQANTYTINDVDILLATKANAANVYSTIQVDGFLAAKMSVSVYDADLTGVVDNSQRLNGQYASFYVTQTDLANAIFNAGAADMRKADNLIGLYDYAASRANLSVYSIASVDSLLAGKTDASTVSSMILLSAYTKSEVNTLLIAKANDNSVLHTTGSETASGTKIFTDSFTVGDFTQRALSISISNKNNANAGGIHWSLISDADGVVTGVRQFSIWGYPHKTSDGSIGSYERFMTYSFPTYDGISTATKLIEVNSPFSISDGHAVSVSGNTTHSFTPLSIYGNSDTNPLLHLGDGGVVYTRLGRTVGNIMYMDTANYGGNEFEMRGKYKFMKELRYDNITDQAATALKIGSRYHLSGVAHNSAGHIIQQVWGNATDTPEGSGNDGGWGYLFGTVGNPYIKMLAEATYIGRIGGDLNLRGISRVYGNASNSHHIAIWNDGTYNKIDSAGLPLAISGETTLLGSGRLLTIGDDAAFYDVNQENTLQLAGQQNTATAILKLGTGGAAVQGNADGTLTLVGYSGIISHGTNTSVNANGYRGSGGDPLIDETSASYITVTGNCIGVLSGLNSTQSDILYSTTAGGSYTSVLNMISTTPTAYNTVDHTQHQMTMILRAGFYKVRCRSYSGLGNYSSTLYIRQ